MTVKKNDPKNCVHEPEELMSERRPLTVKVQCLRCDLDSGVWATRDEAWEAWKEITGSKQVLPSGKNR